MAKKIPEKKETAEKPKKERKKRGKYDEKLIVKGSFMDIIKAVVKEANDKVLKKKA